MLIVICRHCKQAMIQADGCGLTTVDYPDGVCLPAVSFAGWPPGAHDGYHPEDELSARIVREGRCRCGCKPGYNHHPGCDMEDCPRCEGQLISCGCLSREDDCA